MSQIDFLDRFCKELPTLQNKQASEIFPVSILSTIPTFVLLAEPGMGKSSVFRALADAKGILCLTASQVVTSARSPCGTELLIDAFDETRDINNLSLLSSINQVVQKNSLSLLGISCRIADWHSGNLENLTDQIGSARVFELLPLNVEQQIKILSQKEYEYIKNPQTFIEQAEHKGFQELLGNPQTLMMLAKSVKNGNGAFPDGRNQAYELACKQLLREHNRIHDAQISSEIIRWKAAGWLACVTLLADTSSIATTHNVAEEVNQNQVTILSQLELPANQPQNRFDEQVLLEILHSRIFRKDNEIYSFVHRSVAEYMAAQYLANELQIGHILPNRLASVMLSQGLLINNLRGLAGMLASLSPVMKTYLFQADPAAIIDYGDLTLLASSDKENLIKIFASHQQTDYQWGRWSNPTQYQPLADCSMQSFTSKWLCEHLVSDDSENDKKYIVAEVLLIAILAQPKSPHWADLLAGLIQNPEIPIATRERAIKVWLVHESSLEKKINMVNWVHENQQYDPEQEILGRLLENLYPNEISPSQILNYWHVPNERYIGSFLMFWDHSLDRNTPDQSLLPLLKCFEKKVNKGAFAKNINDEHWYFDYQSVPRNFSKIVIRAITCLGESIETETLSTWLGWFDRSLPVNQKEDQIQLNSWKQEHVDRILQVVEYRLRQNNLMGLGLWRLSKGLSIPDKKMENFWLAQCAQLVSENLLDSAQICLNQAFSLLGENYDEALFQKIERLAHQHPKLTNGLEYLTVSPLEDNWMRKNYHHEKEYEANRRKREAEEAKDLETLLNDLDGVKEGEYLNYLYHSAWLDMSEYGDLGDKRIKLWQEKYPELMRATHEGYLTLLKKEAKKYSIKEIVDTHVNNKTYYLELPCRVAVKELYSSNKEEFWGLGRETLCAVLTFELIGHCIAPDWAKTIALHQPDWFIQTWQEVALQCMESKEKIDIPYLNQFSINEEFRSLILQALPKILYHWRADGNLGSSVYALLLATLVYEPASAHEVSGIIEKCLASDTLYSWQRVYLLFAGLWVDENKFILDLEGHLSQKHDDRRYLLEFIANFGYFRGDDSKKIPKWSPQVIKQFILWTASVCSSKMIRGVVSESDASDNMRSFLFKLINERLFQTFTDETHEILVELAASNMIGDWCEHIAQKLPQYILAIANRRYQTPNPSEVVCLLNNKAPINHNDFIVTVMNALKQLQVEVRNSSTNLRYRFWEVDRYSKPTDTHRPENECRNVIADWLIPRISNQAISLSPESTRGESNRTDIDLRVHLLNAKEMVLPIEVKGDWNSELWTAPKDQLYQKYSTDLRCGGYGIYLVLWSDKLKHRQGQIQSPEQLHDALLSLIRQDPDLQNIQVYVLNISQF